MGVGAAIVGGALIGGASSIIGGNQQAKAARSQAESGVQAARIQQETALSAQGLQAQQFQAALDEQKRQYNASQEALRPYQDVGQNALYQLKGAVYGNAPPGINTFYKQPEYTYDSKGRITGTTIKTGGVSNYPSGASYNWDTGKYTPAASDGTVSMTPGIKYDPYGPPSPLRPGMTAGPSAQGGSVGLSSGNYLAPSSYGASTALPQAPDIQYQPNYGPNAYASDYGISTGLTSAPDPFEGQAALPNLPTNNVSAYPEFGAPGSVAPGTYDASKIPDFQQSPGYQFQLSEGQKALDRSLAARGLGLSGAGVKEGIRYATGLASQDYNNYFNQRQQELARRQGVFNDYQTQRLANIAQQEGLTQDEFNRALALSNTAYGRGQQAFENRTNLSNIAYNRGQQDFATQQAAANNNFLRQLELSNTAYGRQQGEQQNAYNQYQDYLNRVASLAGIGQTATTQGINLGQNYASNLGNLYTNQGNTLATLTGQQGQAAANAAIARGQGAAGVAQAWGNVSQGINNAIQGGLQNYLTYNYWKNNPGY
jgi:hypothetical protein